MGRNVDRVKLKPESEWHPWIQLWRVKKSTNTQVAWPSGLRKALRFELSVRLPGMCGFQLQRHFESLCKWYMKNEQSTRSEFNPKQLKMWLIGATLASLSYFGSTNQWTRGNCTFVLTPQMLCHCFGRGLFYFLVKPDLSTAHWEIKTRSFLWPAATEEVPYPCHHQWLLLRHHFTPFLGSCFLLPKICDGLVWGHQRKTTDSKALHSSSHSARQLFFRKHHDCTASILVGKAQTQPLLEHKSLHSHHSQHLVFPQAKLKRTQNGSWGPNFSFQGLHLNLKGEAFPSLWLRAQCFLPSVPALV